MPGPGAETIPVVPPISHGRLKAISWPEFLHIPQVRLLNDLEATGYGLQLLRPDEIEDLNPDAPSPPPDGTRALLAAGTGLGESLILWTGKDYQICPSEGGHADFAPNNDLEIELLRYLRTSYLHVSYERVLSGPGLHLIYQFLRDTQKNEPTWFAEKLPTGDPATLIAEAGLEGKPDICKNALQTVCFYLRSRSREYGAQDPGNGGSVYWWRDCTKDFACTTERTIHEIFFSQGPL